MKIKHLLAAFLCCLLLTACSDLSLTGYDILSPPHAQGARSGLRQLIRESVGESYTPVYPAAGEYQNAVIERDVDGDGSDEAIVLCRAESGETRVLFFRLKDYNYAAAGQATLPTAVIDRIDFADLDGNATEELILLYPDGDSASLLSSLTVLDLTDAVRQADMPASYNEYIANDIDGDAVQDILLLSLSSPVGSASAKLLRYAGGSLSVQSSCELDSQLTDFSKITCGSVSEGINGVFVDGSNAAGEYTTQVLYYDPAQGGMFNPLFIYAGYESTRRTERISSSDIDRDGLIEFPVCSLCDYSAKENPETVCRRLTWNNYRISDMELISKKTAVLCEKEGFLFNIDSIRVGSVTARCPAPDTITLYEWEYRDNELQCTDLLLTLHRYDRESFEASGGAGTVLSSTPTDVYTCELNPAATRGYTLDEVKGAFTPIE